MLREESHRQPRRIRRAQRRRLLHRGPHHRPIQNVGLELHQQIVDDHAAIGAQHVQRDAGVLLHRLHDFAGLKRRRLQHRARQVSLVRVARQPRDHAARVVLPIRRVQAAENAGTK